MSVVGHFGDGKKYGHQARQYFLKMQFYGRIYFEKKKT